MKRFPPEITILKKDPKRKTSVAIGKSLIARTKKAAKEWNVNFSDVVRIALDNFLTRKGK